jgi:hypothetical protein
VDFVGMAIDLARGGRPEPQVEPVPGVRTKLWFVHWLWFSFQLLPGRGWWRRVRAAFASLRIRGFVPDVHRRDDPRPSLFMALLVPWFMFVIDAVKGPRGGPPRGGFMYGCNYDRATADRATADRVTADRATGDRATGDRETADRASEDRAGPRRATATGEGPGDTPATGEGPGGGGTERPRP